MSESPVHRVARAATAPVRGYLNDHFEMVKDEVRRVGATAVPVVAPASTDNSWVGIVELETAIAELSLYQGRLVSRLTDEVAELREQVADLERIVTQLTAVVAARVEQ